MLLPEQDELARAILARSDVRTLEHLAVKSGMIDRWQRACTAVEAGLTSPEEVRRLLGLGGPPVEQPRRQGPFANQSRIDNL